MAGECQARDFVINDEFTSASTFLAGEPASVLAHPRLREQAAVATLFIWQDLSLTGWKIRVIAAPAPSAAGRKATTCRLTFSMNTGRSNAADMLRAET